METDNLRHTSTVLLHPWGPHVFLEKRKYKAIHSTLKTHGLTEEGLQRSIKQKASFSFSLESWGAGGSSRLQRNLADYYQVLISIPVTSFWLHSLVGTFTGCNQEFCPVPGYLISCHHSWLQKTPSPLGNGHLFLGSCELRPSLTLLNIYGTSYGTELLGTPWQVVSLPPNKSNPED